MNYYTEYILLALLLCLFYMKDDLMLNLSFNKFFMAFLLMVCLYLTTTFGSTSGVIIALIIIFFISKKREYNVLKESFVPKISKWSPSTFSSPCQIDLDRKMKTNAELSKIAATKQLDEHTNGGYQHYSKQVNN